MWRCIALSTAGVLSLADMASADSLVATRTIRAQAIIMAEDVAVVAADIPGAVFKAADAIGLEARVSIYAGRPIRSADIGPAATVDRNQVIALVYQSGGLAILTEGRALGRGGVGDVIKVMNLASRSTVSGRVTANGSVIVGPNF